MSSRLDGGGKGGGARGKDSTRGGATNAMTMTSKDDIEVTTAAQRKVNKSLEWSFPGSEFTGETFYKVYSDLSKMENNIIDFDMKNLQRVLFPDKSSAQVEETESTIIRPGSPTSKGGKSLNLELVAQRIRAHYLDGSKLIKRCYGNAIEDDFQMYNWGITLCADMSLPEDKAEFLMNLYGKALPKRISKAEFELIVKKHTSYKDLQDPMAKSQKWLDLLASFKIHEVFMKGFAPTIGKRQICTILRVNEIDFQLNFPQITRDMAKLDKYANKLHVCLVEDPCLSNEPDRFQNSIAQRKVYEATIKEEESATAAVGKEILVEIENKMIIEFEKEKLKEHQRMLKRNSMAAEKARVKEIDDKLKNEKVARLKEIKQQREEIEQCKIEIYLMVKEDLASFYSRDEWNASFNKKILATSPEQKSDGPDRPSSSSSKGKGSPLRAGGSKKEALEHKPASSNATMPLTEEERERQEILELMKNYRLSKEEDMKRNRMELQAVIERSLSKGRFSASNLVGKEIEQIRSELDIDEENSISNSPATAAAKGSKLIMYHEKKNTRQKLDPLEKFFLNKNNSKASFDPSGKGEKELDDFQKTVAEYWAAAAAEEGGGEKKKKETTLGSIPLDYDSPNDAPAGSEPSTKLNGGEWVSIDLLDKNGEKLGLSDRNAIEANRQKYLNEEEEKIASLVILEAKKRQKQMEFEEKKKQATVEMEAAMSEKEKQKKEKHDRQLEYYRLQKLEQATRVEIEAKEKKDKEDEAERRRLQKIQELKDFEDQIKRKKLEKSAKIAANLSSLKSDEEKNRKSLLQELQKFGQNIDSKDREKQDAAKLRKDQEANKRRSESSTSAAEKTRKRVVGVNFEDDGDEEYLDFAAAPRTASTARVRTSSSPERSDNVGKKNNNNKIDKSKKNSKKSPTKNAQAGETDEGEPKSGESKIDARLIEDVEVGPELSDERSVGSLDSLGGLGEESSSGVNLTDAPTSADNENSSSSSSKISRHSSPNRISGVQRQGLMMMRKSPASAGDVVPNDVDIQNQTEKIKEYLHAVEDKGLYDGELEGDYQSAVYYKGDKHLDQSHMDYKDGEEEEEEYEDELLEEDENAIIAAATAANHEVEDVKVKIDPEPELAKEELPLDIDSALKLIEDVSIPVSQYDELEEDEEEFFHIISSRTAPDEFEVANPSPLGNNSNKNNSFHHDDFKEEEDLEKYQQSYSFPETDHALNIPRHQLGDDHEVELKVIRVQGANNNGDGDDEGDDAISIDDIPSLKSIDINVPSVVEQTDFTNMLFSDYSFIIQKTEGELRLILRHDDRGDFHGLFIHGFKPNSNAEKQNVLRVGDELLTLNNVIVEGCHLEDVKEALLDHIGDTISMTIRRREGLNMDECFPSIVNLKSSLDSARRKASPRLYHIQEHKDEHLDLDEDQKEVDIPQDAFLITIPYSVPKTQGELRVIIRHDDKGHEHGLYVHGFKPNSKAERQGKLKIGDELVSINGVNIEGGFLEDVVDAMLSGETSDPNFVDVIVKRHVTAEEYMMIMSAVLDPDAHDEEHEKLVEAKYEVVEEHKVHEQEPFKVQKLNLESLQKDLLPIKSVEELEEIPFEDVSVVIEKVDKELKVIVRHDDWGSIHGLFIHGFKSGGKAEGTLQIGDEIISANNVSLEGKFLDDLAVILKSHSGSMISLVVRRRVWSLLKSIPSSARNPFTFRSPMTPKFTVLKALENLKAFEIKADDRHARRPSFAPTIEDLRQVTSSIISGDVKKTDGELRLHIRFDDEGTHHGLFIHGFKPNSNAEKQGLIRAGDEIISINNKFLKGKFLEDVIEVMQAHSGDTVPMTVQRYDVHKIYPDYKPPAELEKKVDVKAKKAGDAASSTSAGKSSVKSEGSLKDGDDESSVSSSLQGGKFEDQDPVAAERVNEDGNTEGGVDVDAEGGNVANTNNEGSSDPSGSGDPSTEPEVSLDDLADYGVSFAPEPKYEKKKFSEEFLDDFFKERIEDSLESVIKSLFDDNLADFFRRDNREMYQYIYEDRVSKVPKTNGELRMHVKHRKDENGLFIHSFKPNSRAEKLGVVKAGDEIIEIEGELVMGYSIDQLVAIFKSHKGSTVNMVVRRKIKCVLYD